VVERSRAHRVFAQVGDEATMAAEDMDRFMSGLGEHRSSDEGESCSEDESFS